MHLAMKKKNKRNPSQNQPIQKKKLKKAIPLERKKMYRWDFGRCIMGRSLKGH